MKKTKIFLYGKRAGLSLFLFLLQQEASFASDLIEQHRLLMLKAINQCNASRIDKLLNTAYVDVNDKAEPGYSGTYINLAIITGACSADAKFDMVKVLLAHGADPNRNVVSHPIVGDVIVHMPSKAVEMTALLIKSGLEPGRPEPDSGMYPIHHVVFLPTGPNRITAEQKVSILRLIVENGSSVSVKNNKKQTPFIVATEKLQDPKVVGLLLDLGSDINVIDSCGMSAIDYTQLDIINGRYQKIGPRYREKNKVLAEKKDNLFAYLKKRGAIIRPIPEGSFEYKCN